MTHPTTMTPRYLIALLVLLTFTGCDLLGSEEDEGEPAAANVVVANQGNFTAGNGSLSFYDPRTEEATAQAVTDLGSVVQSAYAHDGSVYVLENSGGEVTRFDFASGGSRSVNGQVRVDGPRYMAISDDGLGYVTGQAYDADFNVTSTVTAIDLETMQVIATVNVGGAAEGIALSGGRAYVATGAFGASTEVAVVDLSTMEMTSTVDLGCSARHVEADDDGQVFAFCNGVGDQDGEVVVLDGATAEVGPRVAVEGQIGSAFSIGLDTYHAPEAGTIFFILDGTKVQKLDTETYALSTPQELGFDPLGAVAYDAATETLYGAHLRGFENAGYVTMHDEEGAETGRFTVGVAPVQIDLRR